MNSVKVEIYGSEYRIRGDADPDYIQEIAHYVDSKMREIAHSSGIMSQSRIAILAALNIADELHQERDEREKAKGALANQAARLGEMLEDKISVGR